MNSSPDSAMTMTLQQLADETLVEKNTRRLRAKCRHEAIGWRAIPGGMSEDLCLDCGAILTATDKREQP